MNYKKILDGKEIKRMYYKVLELNDLVQNETEKFERKILIENGDSGLYAIALKKGEIIDTHKSVVDAFAYVFDGEAEFHFDAEKFTLKKGQCIMFKKEHDHTVLALKDTKFILAKI